VFLVVFLGDPHACECGERSQGGPTSPDSELPVRAGNDFHLDALRGSGFDFAEESFSDAFEHGGSSREDDVLVEISSYINIAFLN